MNAETVRDAINGMTDDAVGLVRLLLENQNGPLLLRLLVVAPKEARLLINRFYISNKYSKVNANTFKINNTIPGWIEAGHNCKRDEDIAPYAIAEALDPGNVTDDVPGGL